MSIRLLPILIAACVSIPTVHADLDLTPRYESFAGGTLRRAYFADGAKHFAVSLDSETTLSSDERGPVFRFANIPQAAMALRRSPFATPPSFDAVSLPDYAKAAAKFLPAAAESIATELPVMNIFPINQWKSCRLVFNYKVGGAAYTESITFLVLESGQQIVIQSGSRAKDFAATAARADDIIRRWHEVLPGDEKGAN